MDGGRECVRRMSGDEGDAEGMEEFEGGGERSARKDEREAEVKWGVRRGF